MNFKAWEATIQEMVSVANKETKDGGQHRILSAWRAKLEKAPTSLPPFEIDQIVREVRKRMTKVSA
jgi:hypothetical protein